MSVAPDVLSPAKLGPLTLRNRQDSGPSFLFVADESPLHRKLGVYETRA